MKQPEHPLAWWELGQNRRIVAISFLVALFFGFLALFPDVNRAYESHTGLQNFLSALPVVLGLCLAFLELRHSGEANKQRAEQNRLTEESNKFRDEANEYRGEANRLSTENNKLQRDTLELQVRIHQLQEDIENKLTKVRLYARVHMAADEPKLLVANLSEFDLWINQVEVIVTEAKNAKPDSRTIGGARRISGGYTEDDYKLYGALLSINGDRTDRINLKFHVKVVVTGVTEDPLTSNSPEYQLTIEQGRPKIVKL